MGSKPKISVFDLSKASWDAKLPEHEVKPGGQAAKAKRFCCVSWSPHSYIGGRCPAEDPDAERALLLKSAHLHSNAGWLSHPPPFQDHSLPYHARPSARRYQAWRSYPLNLSHESVPHVHLILSGSATPSSGGNPNRGTRSV